MTRLRAGLAPVLVLGLGLGWAVGCGGGADPAAGAEDPATVEQRLLADPRIAAIFGGCREDGYYEEDTSDPTELLLPKLYEGAGLPLNRAVEFLGALGEESVDALAALLAEQRNDPQRSGSIQNTISALGRNPAPRATAALISVLGHPQSLVRVAALRALRGRDVPRDSYETFLNSVYMGVGQEQQLALALMHAADPRRAEEEFVRWMGEGRFGQIEELVAEAVVATEFDEVWEAALEARDEVYPRSRIWIDAARARRGDPEGGRAFEEALLDDRREFRAVALRAAIGTDAWTSVAGVARSDPDPTQRRTACAALVEPLVSDDPELSSVAYEALRRALDDPVPEVADQARVGLLRVRDGEAEERTLRLLDGGAAALSQVLPTLRTLLPDAPGLAERVEDRMLRRIEGEEGLPWESRLPAFQALGLVPSASAARRMLEYAERAGRDVGRLAGRRPHEWFCVHAANSGLPGREVLRDAWRAEPDPVRRLDLLWAASAERDDFSREVLFEALEDEERLHPLERAFAASRLANLGPPGEVAPRLERMALRMEGEARRAVQCVLHTWY